MASDDPVLVDDIEEWLLDDDKEAGEIQKPVIDPLYDHYSKQKFVPSAAIFCGRVKFYNAEKNWGFIYELSTGEELFVHVNELKPLSNAANWPCSRRLYTGEYVNFQVGLAQAKNQARQAVCVKGMFGGPLQFESAEYKIVNYSRTFM